MKSKISANVVALGLVSLCTDAATEMIYPLVPIFIAALGSGPIVLGIIEGLAETTAALLKLTSGIFSDRVRRRKPLVVIGYAISSFARPFTGVVTAAWQVVLIRMIDRVGKGIRTAPRDALIAASTDPSSRGLAYGFHRAMDHSGAVLGPALALLVLVVLAGAFGVRGTLDLLRWIFILSIAPGFIAVLVLIVFVRESAEPPALAFKFSLRRFDRNFYAYLAIVVLFTLGNSSDAFLLFRAAEVLRADPTTGALLAALPFAADLKRTLTGLDAELFLLPLLWAFFHLIKAVCSTPLGALSDRIGRKTVITAGWAIYALVYAGFAFFDRFPEEWRLFAVCALFATYALFYAFSEGAEKAFVVDLVGADERGSAFGLYNFAVGLGALPASLVFGLLYHSFGGTVAFTTGAGLAGCAMVLLALFTRETGRV